MTLKVLMFGWEFPPFSSGGLGTACHGLSRGLKHHDVNVTFVVPKAGKGITSPVARIIGADQKGSMTVVEVDSLLQPYINSTSYYERYLEIEEDGDVPSMNLYGKNLHQEVWRYSEIAKRIAARENFDVIHSHDWMAYQAGINAKEVSGKPLVIHVHATEFDRSGDNPNQYVYDTERMGMHAADKIMAVSQFTKDRIIHHYGVDGNKVEVVHNAVEHAEPQPLRVSDNPVKTVLFLGRITLQKGPDYFLYAAKRVLDFFPNVRFIVAGQGDMERFLVDKAAEMGIADKFLFAGFLNKEQTEQAYRMADLYVLPSVSEPFGITPLEALTNNTPVIISKQSGVSEVLTNALKVDFWDIDDMASKMLSVLRYPSLHKELLENGTQEVRHFNWNESARKCINVYNQAIGGI